MITEKDRIKTCIEKYGYSEEEATRIVKEDNYLLNIDELRAKFDYPELGKEYPEWLDPIDHYKMCCTTVRQMYNGNFARICTTEELAHTLFVNSALKLNTLKNHQHLKSALVTMAMKICRDGMRRQKYWSDSSLDDNFDEDGNLTNYDRIVATDTDKETIDCLNAVMSIKNREVRELLILSGYIIGRIDAFKEQFVNIVNNSDFIDREALIKLLEEVYHNDDVDMKKKETKGLKMKKTRVTLKSILNVYKTDLDITSARLEIGEYLKSTGFIPAS